MNAVYYQYMEGDKPANHQLLENSALGVEKILDQLAIAPRAMGINVYAASDINILKMVRKGRNLSRILGEKNSE